MGEEERKGCLYGKTLSKDAIASGWRIDEDGFLYLDKDVLGELAEEYRKNKRAAKKDAKVEDEQRISKRNSGKQSQDAELPRKG
jgi:hypothetical protein